MVEFYHAIRQTINGTRPLNDKIKYPGMAFAIALIHLSFTCMFLYMNVLPLTIYNTIITLFYVGMGILLTKTERYTGIFIAAFVEILFHSILATVLLGWDWGFMLYTISLIPVIFYLAYTLAYFKGNIMFPMLLSLIVMFCYFLMQILVNRIQPIFVLDNADRMKMFSYYYNTVLTFAFHFICSVLFAVEVQYMRKNLEQENRNLGQIANYDPLTHLLNRRSMNVHMKQAVEKADKEGESFCIIMCDIDDFKKVNDTYGHACGDTVLTSVAGIVMNNVREEDVVCRWGGEEILILVKADKDIASQVAKRICSNVAESVMKHDKLEISVTMTIGVAVYDCTETLRAVIDAADEKLYYGKHHGKNQVVV